MPKGTQQSRGERRSAAAGVLPKSVLIDTAVDMPASPNGLDCPPRIFAVQMAAGLSEFWLACQGGISGKRRPPDSIGLHHGPEPAAAGCGTEPTLRVAGRPIALDKCASIGQHSRDIAWQMGTIACCLRQKNAEVGIELAVTPPALFDPNTNSLPWPTEISILRAWPPTCT
jgi:hypothetical protein